MEPWLTMVVTIVCSIFSSSGLWLLLQKIADKKDSKTKMILGLGHDRIIFLCKAYLKQGWISPDDYENLYEYLYTPYKEMGGNGTAQRLMDQVSKLPSAPPNDEGGK
jgi:hypothetical protein